MIKAYHGTSIENSQKIIKSGYFKKGTWFGSNIKDAKFYGGHVIFECEFNEEGFEGEESWQFHLREDTLISELKAKVINMVIKWEYEWCQLCERPNKIGFNVKDEDWKAIVPEEMKDGSGVLCYNCFETLSYKKKITFTITGLYPVARMEGNGYNKNEM